MALVSYHDYLWYWGYWNVGDSFIIRIVKEGGGR
jgi:hypothetical protein